ncbi:hypothetical protein ACFLTZ_01710 [Chloroflexota bacterium]
MSYKKERVIVIIGAIIIIALAIGLPFLTKPCDNLLPNFALSQLAFSAVAFFIVFLALYFTIVQLRKSMVKPDLKLVFSEKGDTETTINVSDIKDLSNNVALWIVNKGNAVAELFQIELEMPKLYYPLFSNFTEHQELMLRGTTPEQARTDKDMVAVSIYNVRQIPCFVNSPVKLTSHLLLKTHNQHYEKYTDFKIKYHIFGDWNETQKGELRVKCKKNREVT